VCSSDLWSVPLDIIREAVTNALIHSDYTQHGGPIRVAFYDDRIYVESLGGLLPGLTVEQMRSGTSRIRNQVIARMFRETGAVEQWGSGVQRMFRRAAELGLGEPTYVELPGRLRFIVPTRHAEIMAGGLRSSQLTEPGQQPEVTKIPKKVTKISKSQRTLLAALSADSLSRSELLGSLGLTDQSANAARHLQPLIDSGLVEMTEPWKPRTKTQRYRLTEQGQLYLVEIDSAS
jgi:predicted HTH transcriptional regulator